MGIIIISIFATIIGGIVLFFILDFFKKPRDEFTAWVQKRFRKKKKERKIVISDQNREQKLKQLAQHKFNRGREEIDQELNNMIRISMERFSRSGTLHSGMFFTRAIELHTDRIRKLLKLRTTINRDVLLNDRPIEKNGDIELAMHSLKRIAEAQKSAIFGCEHVFNQNEKNNFVREMSKNISQILSNIRRDLFIEKDENLLLKNEGKKES